MLGRGYKLFWFHITTFILFLLQIALIAKFYYLLLDKVRDSVANRWIALVGAAWYGLHPAMAETVNYVIQRGDLYCTLGCVAALYIFARYKSLRRTGTYLVPLTFALLSKPPAIVFPVLLFLYVFFFEAVISRIKKSFLAIIPSLLLSALLIWLQWTMTPRSFSPSIISPWAYRLTQPFVWLRYISALFFPLQLNVDTDLAPFAHLNLRALAGLCLLIFLGLSIWFTSRRRIFYPISFGLCWFVLTQLPTSLYPLSEVENDHRMFFSFVGLILAVIWSIWLLLVHYLDLEHKVTNRLWLRRVVVATVCLVLTSYAFGVHVRNVVWKDEESLWYDDVVKSPHNGRGLMIYGLTQMNKGLYATALEYFERALLYSPNYPTLEINLGIVNGALADAGDQSRAREAERHFQRAISLAPNDDTAHAFYGRWLNLHSRSPEAITQLQNAVALNPQRIFQREVLVDAYNRTGDEVAARKTAQDMLSIAPDNVLATQTLAHPPTQDVSFWVNLSMMQFRQGHFSQSIASARHALKLNPNSAEAYNNIGAAYGAMHQWDDAISNEQNALRLQPNLQIARNNLSLYAREKGSSDSPESAIEYLETSLRLNREGKYEASIKAAQSAVRLNPGLAEGWNNIAAGQGALHHWNEAITAAERAIALKPDFQLAKNNLAWSLAQKRRERP